MSPLRASRPVGVVLLAVGGLMAAGGVLAYLTSGSAANEPPSADAATTIAATDAPSAATTTSAGATSTTTPTASSAATSTATSATASATTTLSPATTAAITTTTAPTTAPPTAAPPTTRPGSERVGEFVDQYADALERDDVDFLLAALHPVVIDGFGLETCRAWIRDEIVLIDSYRIVGAIEGPMEQSFSTPAGTGTIDDAYAATVAFSFRGQAFEAEGGFAEVDGMVHWLGQCR